MKCFVLCGTIVASLLVAAGPAPANPITWTYNWTPSAAEIIADNGGTGRIMLTNEPLGSAAGTTDIVATNIKVASTAAPGHPDVFMHAAYSLALTLTDGASHASGTLTFTGAFHGTISAKSSNLVNIFTDATTQSITLGNHIYTVTIGPFTPPAPPGATNFGSISANAEVSVRGRGPDFGAAEPTTLWLAGLGLAVLGLISWRNRQAAKTAVAGA
jgi:hypothetical protein